ncbi:MAG: ammonium transporter [Eubacteriales bacterium]
MDFGIWFLIGAALVFFMQAGFAMVETGFTRAKNAGNIIMKNLMDFCLGTVMFMLLGFTLMMSENYVGGVIGIPNLSIFTDYANFDWSSFVFNMVFCATTATIVSGAMAERTKFSAYLIYSAVLSAVVYPIEAGWIWNGEGWLCQMGFIDFAGSAAIHTVGGLSALVGIIFLGPRIGKYVKNDKSGEVEVRAIPGHSLTLGALGVFILWFGWYGFNGAAATQLDGVGGLGSIFLTTTVAPAVASVVTMFFTWFKNGKPDVSMTLNASLAGLVGITAGCANMDAFGATMVGLVAGILVVVAVEVLDIKFKLDDPVGAVAVHCANGIWGTLACGLFATETGLFYGGGINQLCVQAIGIVAVSVWTIITMSITFGAIKKFHGLRVSREEEILGLDVTEHALASSYADFMPSIETVSGVSEFVAELKDDSVSVDEAVPVQLKTGGSVVSDSDTPMTKIEIICKQERFEMLKNAMVEIGITGMTVTNVLGFGNTLGKTEYYRGVKTGTNLHPKVQVEIVVSKVPVVKVIETAKKVLYTGQIGDGKIFVYNVANVVKVRTGEEGYDALQGME